MITGLRWLACGRRRGNEAMMKIFMQIEKTDAATRRRGDAAKAGLLFVLVIAAFSLTGCSFFKPAGETKAAEAEAAVVVSVRAAKAEQRNIAAKVTAIGTIFPRQQAIVSAKISAPIARMAVLKNKLVRAGEVIAVLEASDLEAQRKEAVAMLEEVRLNAKGLKAGAIPQANAQTEKDLRDARVNADTARAIYERRRALYDKGGLSAKDLEAAQLALTTAEHQLKLAENTANLRAATINPNDTAVAEARIKEAEQRIATLDTQLSYAMVRAPFTGIVTDQFQFKGEYAAAGAKLINVADTSEIIIKAPFADTIASQIKVGAAATVKPADAPEENLTGRVSLISQSSDATNRTVEVWINLTNPRGKLRSGGAAEVSFATQNVTNAVVIPATAVTLDASNADKGTVMVIDAKSIAHETKVTVGIRTGDLIQITSGLKGDETVVTEGGYALPDGTKVQVSEAGKGDEKEEKEKGEKKEVKKDAKKDE